jgi:hypothetical protein
LEVTYTVTLDDLLAFGEHVFCTSPRAKRRRRALYVFTPAVFSLIAFQHYNEIREIDVLLVILVVAVPLSIVLLRRMLGHEVAEACRRWIEPSGADTGPLRLVLDEDGVLEIAPQRQTKRRWREIRWIEETEHYLYLFDTPRSGFIIPRRLLEVSVYEQLKKKISDMHAKKV